ncbi:MAG TPA: alpha/beta hydrolase [Mycobacteriales bacterium]|nr:alpha/beta hydrolase [Mycobacteriales bacterium]
MRRPVPAVALLLAAGVLAAGCTDGGAAPEDPATAATTAPGTPSAPPATTPAPPAPAPSPVTLRWQPCDDGFQCATLPVAVDPQERPGVTVELAVTRRPAGDPARRAGSLVVNPGGPGSSAVEYLQRAWQALPRAVRDRFDLVAFDPRGVGRSVPVKCLGTAEMDALVAIDPDPDDDAELRALQEGARRLAGACARTTGWLLPHVSTDAVARDLDALRAALGEAQLTYLGYSYGTSIGLEYLRQFPGRVRAMVLDSPLDPTLSWDRLLEGQAGGFDRALGAFLDHCERAGCAFRAAVPRSRHADLGAAYDALAARVDEAPLPADGPRRLGPAEFSLGVGAGLYSRASGWPAVAAGLAAAQRGDGSVLLALSDAYLDRTEDGYTGSSEANLAVNCTDRPWPREPAPYLALAERVRETAPRFGPAIALSGLGCAVWPEQADRAPAAVTAPQAPPVLVLATTRDPATPYAWARALSAQLATDVLISVEGDGHTVYRSSAGRCVRDRVTAYLVDLAVPAPTTC